MQSLFFAIGPEFLMKQMRGLPNRSSKPIDLAYWVQRNFNTEHNPSIERSAEARIAEMDRLLQLEEGPSGRRGAPSNAYRANSCAPRKL